jgi:hypothetical protein
VNRESTQNKTEFRKQARLLEVVGKLKLHMLEWTYALFIGSSLC